MVSLLVYLCSLESQGLTSLSELQPNHIYDAFISASSKEGFCEKIPGFLNYLYREHILDKNYSTLVPKYATPQILPTVYTDEETERLLNAVDQSTPIGKRDYALRLKFSFGSFQFSYLQSLKIVAKKCQTISHLTL